MQREPDSKMKLELPNTSPSIFIANCMVFALLKETHADFETISDVKIATEEAVKNCVLHAYPNGKGSIFITASLTNSIATISVRDNGIGIANVEQARTPLYTTLQPLCTGMGFTIMESFMDEIKVTSTPGKGTKVTLKKKLPSNDELLNELFDG